MSISTQPPSDAIPAQSVEQRFRELEAAWQADTLFLSNPTKITAHWAFQEILKMGESVVPLMLRDLQDRPRLWVWALPRITGEDPVPASDAGNIGKMGEAWLRWGRDKGLRW
jgi:hypothetical protein